MPIIVYCDGGLGNRIRGLVNALYWLDPGTFEICWPINDWCGASFLDIFQNLESTKIIDYSFADIRELLLQNKNSMLLSHVNQFDISPDQFTPISSLFKPRSYVKRKAQSSLIILYLVQVHPLVSLRVYREMLLMLKPSNKVDVEYQSFIYRMGWSPGKFCGFHARLTDSGNKPKTYHQMLTRLLRKNNIVFLSSDSPDAILQMIGKHPSVTYRKHVVLPEKKISDYNWVASVSDSDGRLFNYNIYRSKESTIDAMIDLMILASSRVYPSNGSSFLQVALVYGYSLQPYSVKLFLLKQRLKDMLKYLMFRACT